MTEKEQAIVQKVLDAVFKNSIKVELSNDCYLGNYLVVGAFTILDKKIAKKTIRGEELVNGYSLDVILPICGGPDLPDSSEVVDLCECQDFFGIIESLVKELATKRCEIECNKIGYDDLFGSELI